MTNSNDRALTLFDQVSELNVATLEATERDLLGKQIIPFLPPQAQIKTPKNAVLYVASCMAKGIMPFHGPYAWEQGGKLYIQDPYHLVVKWVTSKYDFVKITEIADPTAHGCEKNDLVSVTSIIDREDIPRIKEYVDAELFDSVEEARDVLSDSRAGVVLEKEMLKTTRWDGQRSVTLAKDKWMPQDPPRGWTWRMVADKRSYMNAIRMKYGMPSPAELRELGGDPFMIDGRETVTGDWQAVTPDMSQEEAEKTVAGEVVARESAEKVAAMTDAERKEMLEKNREMLHPDMDADLTGEKEPDEAPDFLGELREAWAGAESTDRIEDGKIKYLVNQVYGQLGIEEPDWKEPVMYGEVGAVIKAALEQGEEEAEEVEQGVEEEAE